MQERETGTAFKKCHHLGTRIKTLLPHVPCLQRGARDMQYFGGLPLGDPLGLQGVILVEQGGTLGALPSLIAIPMAPLLVINKRSHRSLLRILFPCWQ